MLSTVECNMDVLFRQTLHESRSEWESFSLRQRRLISLFVLFGLAGLLWWGIVAVLIFVL
jgi:hypothetical protein